MKDKYAERLAKLTSTQRDYIKEYLLSRSVKESCKAIGIHWTTPYKWPEWLEVQALIKDMEVDAIGVSYTLLQELAPEAVKALRAALKDRPYRVAAANSILDRAGLPKSEQVDVTSGGQPLPMISEIVVNLPNEPVDD